MPLLPWPESVKSGDDNFKFTRSQAATSACFNRELKEILLNFPWKLKYWVSSRSNWPISCIFPSIMLPENFSTLIILLLYFTSNIKSRIPIPS